MRTGVGLPTMHCHVGVPLLHDSPVLLLKERKQGGRGREISPLQVFARVSRAGAAVRVATSAGISVLTSTSAAPGSLLKHMVMVFRAILKKLVKDTDFPCNKETLDVRLGAANAPGRPRRDGSRNRIHGGISGVSERGNPGPTGQQHSSKASTAQLDVIIPSTCTLFL